MQTWYIPKAYLAAWESIASMLFVFESIVPLHDAVYFVMMGAIHPIIRVDTMTLQQLKYIVAVAEKGSITEAAKDLYISQPSLSGAIKEVEKETKLTIFNRCRAGIALTTEGMGFWGYARQVVQQMELLESRYIDNRPEKNTLLRIYPALYICGQCLCRVGAAFWTRAIRVYLE